MNFRTAHRKRSLQTMPSIQNGSASAAQQKVLATDKISPDGLDLLRPFYQVDVRTGLPESQICDLIGDYDALLVRSETQVTAAIIAAAKKLQVIARAGVGVDNIDVGAATQRGIIVVNSPTGNIAAAAEHTVALLMALARHVPKATASLKGGKWERSKLVGVEVRNKVLGVIGLGKGIQLASHSPANLCDPPQMNCCHR
jgi:D-3-phosphoglycerate dehydrogenase / 2-oxoglutarate reductase